MKRLEAFSLIEIIVTIGIFTVALAVMLPFTLSRVSEVSVGNAAHDIASAIFQQQQYAYVGKRGNAWGIAFTQSGYQLYEGNSLAEGVNIDSFDITDGVSITGTNLAGEGNQINFPENSIRTQNIGYITISNGVETYRVTINSEGLIESIKL